MQWACGMYIYIGLQCILLSPRSIVKPLLPALGSLYGIGRKEHLAQNAAMLAWRRYRDSPHRSCMTAKKSQLPQSKQVTHSTMPTCQQMFKENA